MIPIHGTQSYSVFNGFHPEQPGGELLIDLNVNQAQDPEDVYLSLHGDGKERLASAGSLDTAELSRWATFYRESPELDGRSLEEQFGDSVSALQATLNMSEDDWGQPLGNLEIRKTPYLLYG